MVGLTPNLLTMRFRMLRILCSLERVFGKLRFLSKWLSFCGQLLMVRFLLWIFSCLGVALWQIGVVCVIVMGNRWTTYFFIVLLPTPHVFLCFKLSGFIGSCQESMAWESYFKYLEFDSRLFDVDCMVRMKLPLF